MYNHPTQIFASHGKFLAYKVFRLTSGTKASYYVQVCVAFFLSGLIHTRSRSDGGAFYFFLLQAIAIIFEDVVFSWVKRAGLEYRLRSFSWLGYAWVWCWFLYSFPLFWDSMLHTGLFDEVWAGMRNLIAPSHLLGLVQVIT